MTPAVSAITLMVLIFGFNTLFWGMAGSGRSATRWLRRLRQARHRRSGRNAQAVRDHSAQRFRAADVAVLIPAHNEAAVLWNTLDSVTSLLPRSNVHVVSDGSTDRTVQIAREFGVHVLDLNPNRGKAGALLAAIGHFDLVRRFGVLLLLDADTRLARDYLSTGLPEFDEHDVIAVAGFVKCALDPPPRTRIGRLLVTYRARLYVVAQLLNKYGQASRWANAVSIVPGFASMYRTDVLDRIDIAPPGLVIEDFNMTFEVHAKKLGRIAFRPNVAVAYTQDPDILADYLKQIRRWSLGYWQTVRRHRMHVGRFRLALAVQVADLVTSSITLVLMVPLMIFALYGETLAHRYGDAEVFGEVAVGTLSPKIVLLGFIVPDLLMTMFAAGALRRPTLLLWAPVLPILRQVDAYVCLLTLADAFRVKSNGVWTSPTRRSAVTAELTAPSNAPIGAPDHEFPCPPDDQRGPIPCAP